MLDFSSGDTCVRLASPGDEPELVAMTRLVHEERALPFAYSEERARAHIQKAITCGRNAPDAGLAYVGVIGQAGGLEASVYLQVASDPLSDQLFLREIWQVVLPPFRKALHARTLIEFSNQFASQTLGMHLLREPMNANRLDAHERFIERNGGRRIGGVYLTGATL